MVKLFTHTDLDGIGCEILAKIAFGKDVDVTNSEVSDINKNIKGFLDNLKNNGIYDKIYITDISVNKENAERLSNRPEKVQLLDHHGTALWLNQYPWAHVRVKDKETGILTSGTELMYKNLEKEGLFKSLDNKHSEQLKQFTEAVRDYDTYRFDKMGEDGQPRQRYTEAIDVTKQIDDTYNVVNAIVDINDPEHDKLITAGKEWAQTREKEVEDQLVYENKDVRVFDTNGIFCAASYFSPNQNTICPATVTYNEKFKSITLAFEDGGKQLNAKEIVQEFWGPEAGGREGIAGSPRNVEMTKNDLAKLVNELTERQLKLKTEIMPHQYEGNQMLSSLSIPNNIEKIGEGAFKDCSNLSEMLVTNELLAKTDIASAFEGTNLDMESMEKIVDDFMQTHEGRGMELDANDRIEDEPLTDIEDKEVDPLELNDKIEDEDTADDFGDL